MSVSSVGMLAISIDAELNLEHRGLDQQRSLESVTGQLAQLLAQYRMTATWGVADPAVSAATENLLAEGHEIAVLGDRNWVASDAGRGRFARELARRVSGARAAGIDISSLLLREGALTDCVDLVSKQGLTVVAAQSETPAAGWFARRGAAQPHSLRFGLWNFEAHAALPGKQRRLSLTGDFGSIRRSIDLAVRNSEVCHLAIRALAVAAAGRSALRTLEKVLAYADAQCRAKQLVVMTLAAASCNLTGARQGKPARSILHSAA